MPFQTGVNTTVHPMGRMGRVCSPDGKLEIGHTVIYVNKRALRINLSSFILYLVCLFEVGQTNPREQGPRKFAAVRDSLP